jgi:hypothetical protein
MNEEYETRAFWDRPIKTTISNDGINKKGFVWEEITVKCNGVELKGVTIITYEDTVKFNRYFNNSQQ